MQMSNVVVIALIILGTLGVVGVGKQPNKSHR